MANRALGEDEPGKPREVFELDKDERWQARLEEARARREVALRDKAAGKTPPRPKPWEEQGTAPIPEPIIEERGDDKFDFADRLEQLKRDGPEKAVERPAPMKDEAAPVRRPAPSDEVTAVRRPRKSAAAPLSKPSTPPITDRPPAGEAIEKLRPPVRPVSKPSAGTVPPRRALPAPSLVMPGAPDVAQIAQRYAETLRPDPELLPDPEPPVAPTADVREARPTPRSAWRFPAVTTRPGVRPLGMALGLLALSALPLTTVAPPLEKGPPMPVIAPFPVEPALGVTWSLYARPQETRSDAWRPASLPAPLQVPELGPTVAFQGDVALPAAPGGVGAGSVPWAGIDVPPTEPVRSELGRPGDPPDRPEAVAPPPPQRDGRLSPDRRPAPTRPATLKEALDEIARRDAEAVAGAGAADRAEVAPENTQPLTPPASPLRVTILTPPRADRSVARAFAADVPRRGHDLVRVLEVDQPISTRNIRYFHAEDRAEAARLAREYDAELRDFTWFRPSPVEGTAELWLSGSADETPVLKVTPRETLRGVLRTQPIVLPPPQQLPARGGALLDRMMEGAADALGAGLGLPRRGN